MYGFSRSIYRKLAPLVVEDEIGACANRQRLLDASESALKRLATDRRYFARPARWLFCEVRTAFSVNDQLHVWRVIESHMKLAEDFIEQTPPELLGIESHRQCQAHTRKGTPCQREPLPSRDYCPSHKHLDDTFEAVIVPPSPEELELTAVGVAA